MKIRYFADTDTLYIEFRDVPVSETRDLDENTTLDIDAQGDISAITVEHASNALASLSSLMSRSPRIAPDCCSALDLVRLE